MQEIENKIAWKPNKFTGFVNLGSFQEIRDDSNYTLLE